MKVAMPSPSKSEYSCSSEEDAEIRRGPWNFEEDRLLTHYIARHGEGRWNLLARCSGLKRTGKSCRLRWLNYLKPDVKRGNLTLEEQLVILELHSKWGNRWSKIAQHLPGRTDNEIKNYWRTRVQKQARHLKIDANSTRFRDAIRCFWMPRLLQKMEEESASAASSLSSSSSAMETQSSPMSVLLNQAPQASLAPLAQVPLIISEPMKNLSPAENCTSPSSISSSDSMNSSQLPKISEYLTSKHEFGNIAYNSSTDYDIGGAFNLSSMSASNYHMAESNWVNGDMENNLWNMDDLW